MNLDLGFGADGFGVRDVITALLVLLSALMCFAAGVGLVRFPDVLSRLHAATKPQILGLIAIVADVAVTNPSVGTVTLAVAIVFFQGLTAPASAHMAGRAAYRTGHFVRDTLLVDEFARVEKPADGPDLDTPDAPDSTAELGEESDSPADDLEKR